MPIRVLVADDHTVLRDGLRVLIAGQRDMVVAGEVADASHVAAAVARTKADVVLLDLSMPGGGGLAAIDQLRARGLDPRILVLTMHEEPGYLRKALAKGVHGFLLKRIASEHLLEAIRSVAGGGVLLDPTLPWEVDDEAAEPPEDGEGVLSPREREVLLLVASGHTNQEAADRLDLSVKTVEGYRARLMRKINARTRADLVRYAFEAGFLEGK